MATTDRPLPPFFSLAAGAGGGEAGGVVSFALTGSFGAGASGLFGVLLALLSVPEGGVSLADDDVPVPLGDAGADEALPEPDVLFLSVIRMSRVVHLV